MRGLTLEKITEITGGIYHGPESLKQNEVTGVDTDSRKIGEGMLFAALRGNRVDGHSFVAQVLEAGALCTLVEEEVAEPYIRVDSVLTAIQKVAAYYRSVLDVKVIGITGSVGKTSTKETVASILSERYRVLKTEGNFNNKLGLPLTLLRIRDEHEIAVVEMGISQFGEMRVLTGMAQPDYCILTNIGMAHIEYLGDRAGILRAKSEIFESMQPDGTAFLNGDDDMLCTVTQVCGKAPVRFGLDASFDFYADGIESRGLKGTDCVIHGLKGADPEEGTRVHIPVPGEHVLKNVLAASAVATELGMTADEIRHGISELSGIAGRGRIVETDRFLILDDCYNANPVSMKSSLDVLAKAEGRRVAILGDMYELGPDEKALHAGVGAYSAEKTDLLLCVGELGERIAEGARAAGLQTVRHFGTKNELFSALPFLLKQGDTILIKASNGMKFSEIVQALWS